MRCPTCQGETGPAAIRCADCGAPLSLPDEGPTAPLDRPLDLDRRAGRLDRPGPGEPTATIPAPGPSPVPAPRPPAPSRAPRPSGPLAPATFEDLSADPAAELLPVPPRGGVIELRRGSSLRRATAWAVDALPFALATAAVASLLGAADLALLAPLATVAALASFTYQTLSHWLSGATFGKRLVGLRVVGPDGRAPGPGRSALRSAAAVAGVALLGAGPLLALFTRSGRAVHDWVAGTSVVDAP
jgi:uncharacterized RDD family membrane protein YckC